ncbi:helix-turn-helix transcriptional regulator [Mycobacterium antarcticum]|uniref:helix-turn-helix transcriptional regulator n=1 Tax=Mycolicibacterium sp. TUM20984 TaxID=3023368 RepID=UPI0023878868|nr:AAA family ATPase [Mycolicibacterium sp. TUM20984]GLP82007.1 LuxR family transcriptional regulator [Mycolicibacterium sp. TUM20984]
MSRSTESRAAAAFLASAATRPSVLIVEGEAGIGKTTLWLQVLDEARDAGFRVLPARADQAESGLTYAVLADLLEGVDGEVLDTLPSLQRIAIDRVLLQGDGSGPVADERVVASAFLSLVERLAADVPVVVAVDDVQWLDSSSQAVIAFATRRLKGRVGVLVTERTETGGRYGAEWLKLNRLDGVDHVHVGPLSLGGLRKLISSSLGRSFSRPTIVRISELSGGNPFYALELARAIDGQSSTADAALPGSLADLVRTRLDQFGEGTQTVLLAAASVGAPTVDLLAQVTEQSAERVVELLEAPEANGIVQITGNRVSFTHPLLARGVYSVVGPARRRQMHRTLAAIVEQPEKRARHLALATSSADPETLLALDTAADAARERGAPAAAAELLDLAINLGGDTPARRIRCAENHFQAGEPQRADQLLKPTIDQLPPGPLRASALNLLAFIRIYDDSLVEAIDLVERAISDADGDCALVVRGLLLSTFANLYLGKLDDAVRQAHGALEHARGLSMPALTSQVLSMLVLAKCTRGDGVDDENLQRALDLEDRDADVPMQFRACAVRAITHAWTGQLDAARREAIDVRKLCLDRGAESDVMMFDAHTALADVWRGDFAAGELVAEEAIERAEHIDTQNLRGVALAIRATVFTYMGRAVEARADAQAALTISIDTSTPPLFIRATMALGFLELSLGNHAEALTVLEPLIAAFDQLPGNEIRNLEFVPDAIELLINASRLEEAEPLIARLEADGRRLDRPWLLATGARGRAMWSAAKGDLDDAMHAVTIALDEHARLEMPFERARTLLLLGQLQRRQRLKQAAAHTFGEALREFERMGALLWADRARAELDRTKVATPQKGTLTITEQRIAELATSGMTNRDIASNLFISLKTVEANLTQIYRKLGIRSRAQLAVKLKSGGL